MVADSRPLGTRPNNQNPDSVASLIVWIREQPQKHCQLAGELDSVLWYLHMVWAKLADKEQNFQTALEEVGINPHGLLSEAEQKQPVRSDAEATKCVLRFWAIVGSILGIEQQSRRWPISMTAKDRGRD